MRITPWPAFALLLGGVAAAGNGPDITVLRVAGGSDFHHYGVANGIAAYSFATTSCNPGSEHVNWTNADHPVIGQNLFRLRDGFFEHMGQSWLKHGFCAVNENGCGTCQNTSCDTLGIGCADTYWATLNDGASGGPKWQVNALTGQHPEPYPSPTGPSTIRGRLQVQVADIDPSLPENSGSAWFAEAQYVSAHEAQAGNSANSNSWCRLVVNSIANITQEGGTHVGEAAAYAWRSVDGSVLVSPVQNNDEGGPSVHGHFVMASRAYDIGGGMYRYVYTVENLTSKQSAASIRIPLSDGITASNLYFHDVPYHSGEPYDGTDWSGTVQNGEVSWSCPETYQQNPNANAIRWGTMYTFAFDSNAAPQIAGGSEIGLFEPGTGSTVSFNAWIPGEDPIAGVRFCFGDGGSLPFCPCLNFGEGESGCSNGTYWQGARLSGNGDASVASDTVVLSVARLVPNQQGLFLQGDDALNGGAGFTFGDGLRCAGVNVVRLESTVSSVTGTASSTVPVAQTGGVSAGDVKRYQYWYRDPNGTPCGSGFNLTNGFEIAWTL